MATATQIPLAEYLATSYRPDREYLEGELEERHLGKREHARLQALITIWLGNHERDWSIVVLTEQRIQVSFDRIRIPDIVLTTLDPQPEVLVAPPLLVVEILSPDDTYASLEDRLRDYQRMGIQTTWLIDPSTRTARICSGPTWTEATRLIVPATPIFLETSELFRQLNQPL